MSSRRPRQGRAAVALVAAGVALSVSACADDKPQNALDPEGPVARQLDNLWDPVFGIATFVFFLVNFLVLFVVFRFRARDRDEAPRQTHGHARAELGWTIAPALVLAVVGFFTVGTIFDINERPVGDDVVQVRAIGHQWWFEYQYDELGIVTANELTIPVGVPIDVELRSDDVIHSFWPPKLAGKVDMIPGRVNYMTIEAEHPGRYWGQCAEYCGESHANMRLRVRALSPADWEDWVTLQRQEARPLLGPTDAPPVVEDGIPLTPEEEILAGYYLFHGTGACAGCHKVEGTPAEGVIGPNLTHLFSRETMAGAMFELNEVNLRRWLRDPQAQKPGNKMEIRQLSEEEITYLIAYLKTLQ